ncbi:Kcnh7, partial [Symbiodinium sp. KB8]
SQLQRFVFGPESHLQLVWAALSALFIVWDLVTLPLLFFDLGEFARHLEYIALATLAFWLLDMPMHVFFAVATTAGMVETRPWVLARRYARSWLLLDVFIAFVDTFVLTLHFMMEADPNP